MSPSTAVLLLLFGSTAVSTQNCSQPYDVLNAQLLDRKDVYQKGDTVSFACDVGYTSGLRIRHECTDEGWKPLHTGTCRLKPCVLPDDIPNGYYQMIRGEDFVFGTTIKYFCNEGYRMASIDNTRTCLVNGWSNHAPVCESLSCDAPSPAPGVTVGGLPMDDEPIQPDRVLTFSCEAPGNVLNGSETLVCGKDGTWDQPFPNCIEVTCEVPKPTFRMRIFGGEGGRVMAGNRITVVCVTEGRAKQVECLSTGQWSSAIPTCQDTCDVAHVSGSVLYNPRNVRQIRKTQSLDFSCKDPSHILHGTASITCLEDGKWSHPFPSCAAPLSCATPPALENGDFLFTNTLLNHNTKVEYLCQSKYVMVGGPYKTCQDGEWTGDIRCLKPCTVNSDLMGPNKVRFRWDSSNKLYAPHNDYIGFECISGARHDGQVEMRQKCINGEMSIPRCV